MNYSQCQALKEGALATVDGEKIVDLEVELPAIPLINRRTSGMSLEPVFSPF
jgi:hypothetical protein